jgi:hypothetical protein
MRNCCWHSQSRSQWNLMSMALVCLNCTLLLMTLSAIASSVCNGVGGCTWLSSSSMILMYTALQAIMYRPAISALVAEDITFLMMCAMFSIAPLFGGTVLFFHLGWKNTLCFKFAAHCCVVGCQKRDYTRTNTIAKLIKSS